MTTEGSASNHLVTKSYIDTHNSNNNYLKTDGSNFMTGDLNMNEQTVKNMLDPSDEADGVNKRCLEAQLQDYVKRNGQNSMTFNLNMNNYKIENLKNFDSNNTVDTDVPNIKYIKDNYVNRNYVNNNFLKFDGSNHMSSNLDMGTNKIENLSTPASHENDAAVNVEFSNSELNTSNQNLSAQRTAAYKKYVNESHVTPSGHVGENAFRYLMEDAD